MNKLKVSSSPVFVAPSWPLPRSPLIRSRRCQLYSGRGQRPLFVGCRLAGEGQLLSAAVERRKEGKKDGRGERKEKKTAQCENYGLWLILTPTTNPPSEPLRHNGVKTHGKGNKSVGSHRRTPPPQLPGSFFVVFSPPTIPTPTSTSSTPRRWRRRLCSRSGVPVLPAPCKT